MAKKIIKSKKKQLRNVLRGRIYIQATFNNTLITVTDEKGNVLSWSSAGASGFKGTKKSTPFAASTALRTALQKAEVYGLKEVNVYIAGVGSGRDSAARAIGNSGLGVLGIHDITPIPHNGPRPKKTRRV